MCVCVCVSVTYTPGDTPVSTGEFEFGNVEPVTEPLTCIVLYTMYISSLSIHILLHTCIFSTMHGRIKGTNSSINSVLRTVVNQRGIYRTGSL